MNQTEPETAKFLKKLRNVDGSRAATSRLIQRERMRSQRAPSRARSAYFVLRALWPKALKNIFQTNPTA